MAGDPSGGTYRGLDMGRLLAKLPQSGSIEPARRVIDGLRHPLVADVVAPARVGGTVSQSFAGDLAPATAVHVIAQVERVLDAEVSTQNRRVAITEAVDPFVRDYPDPDAVDPAAAALAPAAEAPVKLFGAVKPTVQAAQADQPKGKPMSNITGASQLGASANKRIVAAKAKIAEAQDKMDGAFKNLDSATLMIEDVAAKVEQEAADLTSATAQLTNGG